MTHSSKFTFFLQVDCERHEKEEGERNVMTSSLDKISYNWLINKVENSIRFVEKVVFSAWKLC